ncbi:MAG: Ribosomal subunit interface protein [Candidatus Ozemobacter sibiricus]|jgi:putative sigma-54 modulation protein|uniref:Ribosome hibernation promoting factor n=1 Tax=Candidatus Ozemobacter sibiricus TaxID=2268124 RepID=A0A367ZME6_9BACT|nr:MAG: Ribosomal subunit interface protein [Candidatus Ozemobacter sibiricus]
MQLVVTGKNIHLSKALKDYAEKKLSAIKKYFDHIIEVDVTLSVDEVKDQTRSKVCEVTVWANGIVLRAKKASEDLYASIDMVADKIERQVKKYKDKQRDLPRRQPNKEARLATHTVLEIAKTKGGKGKEATAGAPAEQAPRIVRSGTFPMKPMFADEAAQQLELLKQGFFVFSNAETNQINVIYKRSDGNFGLIEPEY